MIYMNQKLVIQNDLKMDVQEHKRMLGENEQARDQLHENIRAMTVQHQKEADAYLARQNELNAEVDKLNGVIQDQREEAARTKEAHLNYCEKLN